MAATHPTQAGLPVIHHPRDLERIGSNEKHEALQRVEPEAHSVEYQEYLDLVQEFTGPKLSKLNVSLFSETNND